MQYNVSVLYSSMEKRHLAEWESLKSNQITVTHPLRKDEIYILFQSETPLPAVRHLYIMWYQHINRIARMRDTEKYTFSTLADKVITIKIEDRWVWRWLGPL